VNISGSRLFCGGRGVVIDVMVVICRESGVVRCVARHTHFSGNRANLHTLQPTQTSDPCPIFHVDDSLQGQYPLGIGTTEPLPGIESRLPTKGSRNVILVTGATGFIGSYTVRALRSRGHEVVALSRYDYRPEALRVIGDEPPKLVKSTLHDSAALGEIFDRFKPRAVVHLDAYVNPVALKTDPLKAIEMNVNPTITLLELCRTRDVERFVFASTVGVLPSIRYEPIDTAHPLVTQHEGPTGGFYGVSKAVSEIVALGYADAFPLDVRIVRPSAVYGFGMQWPLGIKPLVEGIVEGKEVTLANRGPLRDFTPVQDVAEIVAALTDCDTSCDRVVNAGTGQALLSPADLADVVRETFPHARLSILDEDLDPTGVESRYRGVLDMAPVREQLKVERTFDTLGDGLRAYADEYRAFIGE
jgi:nucleoside-diphosphate-sugar epimerase